MVESRPVIVWRRFFGSVRQGVLMYSSGCRKAVQSAFVCFGILTLSEVRSFNFCIGDRVATM